MIFYFFILFLISQRIIELIIASKHSKILRAEGAEEYDTHGYKIIVLMHTLFFISLILENIYIGHINNYSFYFFIFFLAAQILRYWAIISLGKFWNTRLLTIKGTGLVKKGIYKYTRHPNYLAVFIEFICIPLIFSLYFTFVIFSICNLIVLARRIKIENKVLSYK